MDLAEIAYNITNVVLKIRNGQIITLSSEIHNGYELDNPLIELPFLEEIALCIRKKKAFPVLDIASENLRKRSFMEVNSENFPMPNHYYEKWVSMSDIFIDFSWRSNPYFVQDIPNRYIQQFKRTVNDLWLQIQKQNKKIVMMGFPTEALAKFYNINYSLLKDSYFDALNCNYQELKKSILILEGSLAKSEEWNLLTEDRNLNFRFQDSKANCYYGDFNNSPYLILPTGKIEKLIDTSTLDGIFYAETLYFENIALNDVQVIFEKGTVHGVDFLNRQSANHTIQNLLLNRIEDAFLCIGMNPNLKNPVKYSLFDECIKKNTILKLVINNKIISLSNLNASVSQKDKDILSEV